MKLPKRFALSTLLLVMLFVSLVFGYAQWRRLRVIREIESLNEIGNHMEISEPTLRQLYARSVPGIHLEDGFWACSKEKRIPVYFFKNRVGTYSLAGDDREFEPEEFKEFLSTIQGSLHFIGVDRVEFWQYQHTGNRIERKIETELDFIK